MISVLFAAPHSVYHSIDGLDVWDAARNALLWPGGNPIVAHPPCRGWSRMRAFCHNLAGEKELSVWAVEQVRCYGGVLEHPAGSSLWPFMSLPSPGCSDEWGHTLIVDQWWWGHLAQKRTLLYIVGCKKKDVPIVPLRIGRPSHTMGLWRGRDKRPGKSRPEVQKKMRSATPISFALWLIELASRCTVI